MAEITIGKLHLNSDGKILSIGPIDHPELAVSLEATDTLALIDFLNSLATTDFNSRHSFRVPVWSTCGLNVEIRTDDDQRPVIPLNISLTGILVAFQPNDELDLPIDSQVEVTLQLEELSLTMTAITKRRTNNGYSLLFPDSISAGEVHPHAPLTQLVMELQRRWTAHREENK